jgi:hypothetical protein
MRFALFLSLFICPKDTARCGDVSSHDDVIEVVIYGGLQKSPGRWFGHLPGLGLISDWLE